MNSLPDAHPPVARPGVGVLLVNLGTPDAPTPGAVTAYLREFLSDPRVVEIPPLIWQPILRGVILHTRDRKSVVSGKSVSVRVVLVFRRLLNQHNSSDPHS